MGEGNKVQSGLMDLEEFKEHINTSLNLRDIHSVMKFKSVLRAFKRGHINTYGVEYPRRPFNNRGNSSIRKGKHSRRTNEIKKSIYAQITRTDK